METAEWTDGGFLTLNTSRVKATVLSPGGLSALLMGELLYKVSILPTPSNSRFPRKCDLGQFLSKGGVLVNMVSRKPCLLSSLSPNFCLQFCLWDVFLCESHPLYMNFFSPGPHLLDLGWYPGTGLSYSRQFCMSLANQAFYDTDLLMSFHLPVII